MPVWSIALSLFFFSIQSFSQSYFVRIKTTDPVALESNLAERGFDLAGFNRSKSELGVILESPSRLSELSNLQVVSVERSEPLSTYSDGYFNVEQTNAALKKLEETFPQHAKVFDLNQLTGAPKTHEGRSVLALHVSNRPTQILNRPKILVNGLHHAREVTTHHAVLDSAEEYLNGIKNGDTQFQKASEEVSVWFVPVVNPDGLNHVFSKDRMWRKNRAHNLNGSIGVDLNRNYKFKWGACGVNSDDENSDVFKGISPHSEPEVQLMSALNAHLRFQYSVSYHSYGDEILHSYLCGTLAEQAIFDKLRAKLMSTLGFGTRPASSSGEDHEHHYNQFGTLSFLIELGEEFQPPFATYKKSVWPNVKKVLPLFLEEAMTAGISIRAVDADTGKPVPGATVSVREILFKEGEIRSTDSFGTYRWNLMKGSYQLLLSGSGFNEMLEKLEVGDVQQSFVVKLQQDRFALNSLGLFARFFPNLR